MVLAGSSFETWALNNVVRKLFWYLDDGSACEMKVLIRLARARAAVLTRPRPPSAVFLNGMGWDMIISVGHLDRPELPYVNTSSLGVINLPFLKTFTYFLKINAVRRLQSVKRYGRLKSYPIVLIIHSFCSVELTKSWNTWCLNSSGSEELECEHCAIPPEVNNLRSARSSYSSFLFLNTIEQTKCR